MQVKLKKRTYWIGWEFQGETGSLPVSAHGCVQAIERFQRRWRAEHQRLPDTYWIALCPECLTGHQRGGHQ